MQACIYAFLNRRALSLARPSSLIPKPQTQPESKRLGLRHSGHSAQKKLTCSIKYGKTFSIMVRLYKPKRLEVAYSAAKMLSRAGVQ